MQRVVTLIASATEIVAALGCADRLVGRSHECDWPADVLALPALTSAKLDLSGSSGDIDAQVRRLVADGLSVYRVDADRLDEVRPDLIVTQDHCEVCAVSLKDVEAAVCHRLGADAAIVTLRPTGLADVYADIARVAEALGVAERGRALVAEMTARLEVIARRAAALPKPRVAFIEWADPLMCGGNWMPTLIELAGGWNLFGTADGPSEVITLDGVVAARPDVIVIAPCGYDLAASVRDHEMLSRNPRWSALAAVQSGRVVCADGNAYFNRPGPRLAETAEILAEILHPEIFAFGHEGTGWRAMDALADARRPHRQAG